MTKLTLRTLLVLLTLTALAATAVASPVVDKEEKDDWWDVSKLLEIDWDAILPANPGFTPLPDPYEEPFIGPNDQLYVMEPEDIDGPGLVMYWDDPPEPDADKTSAWKYVYDEDPILTGETLRITFLAPDLPATGTQINSIGVGLLDINGAARVWSWMVAPLADPTANAVGANMHWDATIGPIAGAIPPDSAGAAFATDRATGLVSVDPLFYNNPAFDPAQVTTIIGLASGSTTVPVSHPGDPTLSGPWVYWSDLHVTPEPATLGLLAVGGCLILFWRKRR